MNNENLFPQIQEYMDSLFEKLSVKGMPIRYTKNMNILKSPTTITMIDLDHEVIYVNDIYDYNVAVDLLFFCLAHEARHIYQLRNGMWITNESNTYPQGESEEAYEEYRLQPEEVDANAFAYLEMERLYGKNRDYDFGEKVMKAILERVEWIKENEKY